MATTTQPLLRGIDGRRHFKDFFGLLEVTNTWENIQNIQNIYPNLIDNGQKYHNDTYQFTAHLMSDLFTKQFP